VIVINRLAVRGRGRREIDFFYISLIREKF
jgi:hypothetical protein